jgi:MFS family permease
VRDRRLHRPALRGQAERSPAYRGGQADLVVVAASLIGGKLSDRTGRRKVFVLTAAVVYGLAMFALAIAGDFNGFLVGMAIGGLGFGVYVAVDLALVVDVLPDQDNAAKDLGVFNVAGALPFSGERYSPEGAALLLGAWAVVSLAVGVIILYRRDP